MENEETNVLIVIKNFLQSQNIADSKVNVKSITEKGQNYLGAIYEVKITGRNFDRSVIAKHAQQNKEYRDLFSVKYVYEREEYMYTTFFPTIKAFQANKKIDQPFDCIPAFITSSCVEGNEVIALEDMKVLEYKQIDRKTTLSYSHISLIMKEYGKLHAISFALKQQQPDLFHKLTANTKESFFVNSKSDMLPAYYAHCDRVLPVLEKGSEAYELFKRFRDKEIGSMLKLLEESAQSEYAVIGHGDSKTNNMMFKYEDPKQPNVPTKVCLLDWQLARYGSPVLDLTHFFCICTDKNILNNHFDNLINQYYESLSEFLSKLGGDASKLFPYEKFMEHLKKYSSFGLQMALIVIHLMLSTNDEIPDMGQKSDATEAFVYKSKNSFIYEERIRDLIMHFVEKGLFNQN